MADLIDRQAAIDAMLRLEQEDIEAYGVKIPEGFDADPAVKALKALPSAQPERKTGRWLFDRLETTSGCFYGVRRCSECGMIGGGTRYCPFCGADMRTPTQVQMDEADDVMMGGNDETD